MIDDCNIKNIAKNQVSAVFNSRCSRKCVTRIYRALYGGAIFVPFGGAQTCHATGKLGNSNTLYYIKPEPCRAKTLSNVKFLLHALSTTSEAKVVFNFRI